MLHALSFSARIGFANAHVSVPPVRHASTAHATPQTTIMEPPPQRYAMLPTTQTTLPARKLTTVLVASSLDGPSLKPEA